MLQAFESSLACLMRTHFEMASQACRRRSRAIADFYTAQGDGKMTEEIMSAASFGTPRKKFNVQNTA
jgi:hypothetical protein